MVAKLTSYSLLAYVHIGHSRLTLNPRSITNVNHRVNGLIMVTDYILIHMDS